MTFEILIAIFLLGIALSMDAFAVSITDGLIYTDLNKKRGTFIAATFGIMQALMPLIGYWLVEIIVIIVDEAGGEKAGQIMSTVVSYISFILLIFIGVKMIIEAIKEMKKNEEEKALKKFSYKEVLYFGFVTAIDALASGVVLHAGLSNNYTIWLHVSIIMVCTFVISLIGVFLGKGIERLLKGKHEIAEIIGGSILIMLGVWIILSHYLSL
ncbi:MAG: manganese efflux pump [Bacilli bacterium]|nr:manganese efflux pump [Bacilli bacterium]